MRIAYLIPEFPGQTHNFFWREISAVKDLGTEVALYSTKLPPPGLASTSWGDVARSQTHYLYPPRSVALLASVVKLLITAPRGAASIARSILKAADVSLSGKLRLVALAALGIQMREDMQSRGISHVHVHSCADAAHIAMFASLAGNLTYSLTLHNPVSEYGPNQIQKWNHASFGIVIAKWVLQDLRNKIGEKLPKNIQLAPMGVNLDKFSRQIGYSPAKAGEETNIFCCARLNPGKGYLTLIEAVAKLAAVGHDVRLRIAGEDDAGGSGYRRVLEDAISKYHMGTRIQLLGAVSEEGVLDQLGQAHIFALASQEEPLGVAIMEAMAMALPVVATNAGGVPELIRHGIDGLMVPPNDPQAMADALASLTSQPELAMEISRNARAKAATAFSHRNSAEAIVRGTQTLL